MTSTHEYLENSMNHKSWPYMQIDTRIERALAENHDIGSPSIAIVQDDGAQAGALSGHLDMLGCKTWSSYGVPDLLAQMHSGANADVIIILLPQQLDIEQLRSIRALSDAAMFCVIRIGSFASLLRKNELFFKQKKIDFVHYMAEARTLALRLFLLTLQVSAQHDQEQRIWGEYHFRADGRTVMHKGAPIHLRPKEFSLALEFFRNMGRLLTREQLISGFGAMNATSRVVDVCVCNIRRKLQLEEKNGLILQTFYGRGYQLCAVKNGGVGSGGTAQPIAFSQGLGRVQVC